MSTVKQETVMQWHDKDEDFVYFYDEDDDRAYSMTHERFHELGTPDHITIAVWAGDRLQDERAVREQVAPTGKVLS